MSHPKQFLSSAAASCAVGVLLHLIVPAIVGVVVAVVFSGLTLLDPLYAGDRTNLAWSALGVAVGIQAANTFVTAPVAGALVGGLSTRVASSWFYLVGAMIGLLVHYLFTAVFVAVAFAAFDRAIVGVVAWAVLLVVTLVGPILGFVSVFVARPHVRVGPQVRR